MPRFLTPWDDLFYRIRPSDRPWPWNVVNPRPIVTQADIDFARSLAPIAEEVLSISDEPTVIG